MLEQLWNDVWKLTTHLRGCQYAFIKRDCLHKSGVDKNKLKRKECII